MKRIAVIVLALLAGSVMTLHAQSALTPESVPRMPIEELKRQMNNPDVVIIDVRIAHDWDGSTAKIKGSIREDASKAASWMAKYPPNKTIVLYCA
jgi:rhodanese-related sulfurtransferase